MAFDIAASAYDRFMGRFSEPLADEVVGQVELAPGTRVLDVGCGPGALTTVLVDAVGAGAVSAVDPSPPFVSAVRARLPGVDVHQAAAERLPFADDTFDVALAQLVVHFMKDPVAGLAEMSRVTRPGGTVGASVWDHAGGHSPLTVFWRAVHDLRPQVPDEGGLPGTREGQLVDLAERAGLSEVRPGALSVSVAFETFEDWWEPYTLGVGPAGDHVAGLDEAGRAALRRRCAERLPEPPFDVNVKAWWVTGRVPQR